MAETRKNLCPTGITPDQQPPFPGQHEQQRLQQIQPKKVAVPQKNVRNKIRWQWLIVYKYPKDDIIFRPIFADSLTILKYNLGGLSEQKENKLRKLSEALGKIAAKIDVWFLPDVKALPVDMRKWGVSMDLAEFFHFYVALPNVKGGGLSVYIR